jgi:hypothetical protein
MIEIPFGFLHGMAGEFDRIEKIFSGEIQRLRGKLQIEIFFIKNA